MTDRANFETALEGFRAASEEVLRAHFDENEFTFAVPHIEIGERRGSVYAKLWRTESDPETGEKRNYSTLIHAFVKIETGEIFKPSSTKAPAKHARGNIYEDAGRACLTDAGHVAYMR